MNILHDPALKLGKETGDVLSFDICTVGKRIITIFYDHELLKCKMI